MPIVLVTGIKGFTGRYLAEELQRAGYTVVGLGIDSDVPAGTTISRCDLNDREAMLKIVAQIAPEYVIHLGGIAFAAHGDAGSIYRTNIIGTRNLLEALALSVTAPKMILLASSAHVYGNTANCPIVETTVTIPVSDYAVSKLAMEMMAHLWADRLPIAIVRPFNYTGVGQSLNFLLPKIVDHFRRKVPKIELGNLDVIRDFSDVRDVVRNYRLLLEAPSRGEVFNMCAGTGHSLRDVIAMIKELSGHDMEILINANFVRDDEVHKLIGSSVKLHKLIGASRSTPLKETLSWMLRCQAEAPEN